MSDEFLDFHDRIICPVCGVPDDEFTDYPDGLRYDGDVAWASCSSCDADFKVVVSVSYQYACTSPPKSEITPRRRYQ